MGLLKRPLPCLFPHTEERSPVFTELFYFSQILLSSGFIKIQIICARQGDIDL